MRMGPRTAILADNPPASEIEIPISDSSRMLGCTSAKTHLHGQFARGLFQEAIQQLQNPLLLFQRVEQLAQFFASQMQIQTHQIAGAFHVDLGRDFDIQQTFGVELVKPFKNRVVGRALLLQAPLQLGVDFRKHPARRSCD